MSLLNLSLEAWAVHGWAEYYGQSRRSVQSLQDNMAQKQHSYKSEDRKPICANKIETLLLLDA